MRRGRNIALAVVGGLALILLAVSVIAPQVIDLAAFRQRLVEQLGQGLGGTVRIDALHLSLWPAPHLAAERVRVVIPGAVDVTAASVSAYPRLQALLHGRVQLARLTLAAPDIHLQMQRAAAGEAAPSGGSASKMQEAVARALAAAVASAPGATVEIADGRMTVARDAARPVQLAGLNAHVSLPADRWRLTATCTSELWEQLAVHASLDARTLSGEATIDVTKLRPHLLTAGLLPDGGMQLGDSEMNLALRVSADANGTVRSEVDGSVPRLRLHRGSGEFDVRADRVRATGQRDGSTTTVTISDAQLTSPRLRVSGELQLDERAPHVRARVEGREVDVQSLAQAAAVLAGDVRAVGEIFDVLRGGTVSHVTVQAEGATLADLGNLDTLAINGHLDDGDVHVPGAGLDLRSVTGDASVEQGTLGGEHLAARLGHSQAHDGRLRLGLTGSAPELYVETMVQADVAELPPLLKRLIGNDAVTRGLDRIGDVAGTATGTLLLTGTTKNVGASVEVSPFDVSGRVEGMKLPVHVEGGRFTYAPGGVAASDLKVTVGGSTLSQLAARVDWSREPSTFEATAGTSRAVLEEIYPWLKASGWLPDSPWNPTALSGTLAVRSLHVHGPAATPGDWRFELIGAADKLDIESQQLRQHIAIRYPVSLREVRLAGDATTGISFAGKFAAPDAVSGAIDLVWNTTKLDIKQLSVHDARSDVQLSLAIKPGTYDLALVGNLNKSTLDVLVPNHGLLGGALRGDFRAHLVAGQPGRSTVEGRLVATDLSLPPGDQPLRLTSLSLDAHAGTVALDAVVELGTDSHLHVSGSVRSSPQAFIADLDIPADRLDWSTIEPLLSLGGATAGGEPAARTGSTPVRGTVRFTADAFTYGRFTWKPLRAAVILAPSGPTIRVTEANLCGIAMPGTITVTGADLKLAVKPSAQRQSIETSLQCLGEPERRATGLFNLSADIAAQGTPADLVRSARGRVQLTANNGRVYQVGIAAKVLSAVNIATGSFGDIGSLRKDGLPYTSMGMKADVRDGALVLSEVTVDGPTVKMAGEGSLNFTAGTLDLTVLVAPLKNVDSVVSRIPVVSDILGGDLVSIPMKVSGDIRDPTVTPLSPSAVGTQLIGAMTRTLKLPIKLIEPGWWRGKID